MSWEPDDNLDLFGLDDSNNHAPAQNDVSTGAMVSNRDNHAASSVDTTRTPPPSPCPQDEATTLGQEVEPDSMDTPPAKLREPFRPAFASYLTHTRYGMPGLYFHGQRQPKGDGDPEPYDVWICGPLECRAATHDERNDNHGLLLRFKSPYGGWREWAMPLHLLKGSGEEMRGELLNMGLRINPDAYKLLNKYLAQCLPDERVIAATRVGWHQLEGGRVFVMPRRTLGSVELSRRITFQSEYGTHDDYAHAGTLASWREHIGSLCRDNPLLILAVSTALAGPLLDITHRKSTGIHLVGDSSNGKTTALEVAASVWGGPEFIRTWRATGNGLEGVAAALSDTCLILDEIGEADGREIGATIYALGNGTGKARASRNGTARRPHRWRIAILSSGERTLAAHMSEAGQRPKAGQAVRLLDIPAKRKYGAFDHLHHLNDGRAFADHLKSEVTHHHGHLGPAFIERLVKERRDLAAMVSKFTDLPKFATDHPLQGRAAKALVLIGLAGELATEYGLTGWREGEALDAAEIALKGWRTFQGGVQTEHEQILISVRAFIERHGDSRFSDVDGDPKHTHTVHNRAGYWRDQPEGRVYLLTNEALKEALRGFDSRRGLDALDSAGWIAEREGGKRTVRVQINGKRSRLYAVRPDEGGEYES
jgi:putative DNA primase/helicase